MGVFMWDGFYVLAFDSTSHSMQTEKKAREIFEVAVIPTPRELASDCGFALKFLSGDIDAIRAFHKTLKVPAGLYFLSASRINGKREVERIDDLS